MIHKAIVFFGRPAVIACDANCDKAWGINARPREQLSADPDDYAWLADHELGTAPVDPGTYEGGDAKPTLRPMVGEAMNRWCARECERCVMTKPLKPLPNFSKRLPNYTVSQSTTPTRP